MQNSLNKLMEQAVIAHKENRLEDAEKKYEEVLKIKPDFAIAHNNLGTIFFISGKLKEAKIKYKRAIEINPDYFQAHNNLGNVLYKLENIDEAETSYKKALNLKSNFLPSLLSLGQIYFSKNNFEDAYKYFDLCNTKDSRVRALISLYKLGKFEEIFERIKKFSDIDELNLGVSAFSSFIENITKKDTANNFCKNPLNFIYFSNISSHLENHISFAEELTIELKNQESIWEPFRKSTKKGYQSKYDLFINPSSIMNNLKSIILKEIDNYYSKFKNNSYSLIKKWPSKKKLEAWHVIYKKQGYQNPHNHITGWLSGVIYLKVVPSLENNEGSIEFSLNSTIYTDKSSPKVLYVPKIGDLILFPSSLYHKTIPFTTDDERIIISFNLMPEGFVPNYS